MDRPVVKRSIDWYLQAPKIQSGRRRSRHEPPSLLSRHGFRGVSFAGVDGIEDNCMFPRVLSPGASTTVPFPLKNTSPLISMDRALSSPNKAVVFVRRNLSPY